MKKAISMILASVLSLSIVVPVFAENETDATDYTTGTPWLCVDLEGNVTADTPADLKDNYALWANKDRILRMEIPEGGFLTSNSVVLAGKAEEEMKALYHGEVPEDHDARLAYDYYGLLCDWESRDARGVAPLKEMVDEVEGITSLDALTGYFVNTPGEERIYCLWRDKVQQDAENPGHQILSVNNGYGLIPDPAEYVDMTDFGEIQKEACQTFFGKMLKKLGYSEEEAEQKFDNCLKWETMLNAVIANADAENGPDRKAGRNIHFTRDELLAATPNIPILDTLEHADGYPVMDEYVIPYPAVIEKLNELYTEENLPLMRDYLILHGVYDRTEALDFESYAMVCDCQDIVAGGMPLELKKEEYADTDAYNDVISMLGGAVSKFYVQKYARPEDKERISELVDEIVHAYYGIIEDAGFITDETRAGAIAKLDHMTRNVLYPDNWEPYSFEDVNFASKEEGGRLWEAYCALKKHDHDKTVAQVSKPYDRTTWDSLPFRVNCEYAPSGNGIYINAAYAQDPNYRADMSEEELYAYMGTAIAHEISHAFDAFGAMYDKDGNYINWWTDEDYSAFSSKNEKLAAYFNAMHPWEGQDFNGEVMIGEACADMAALKCMLSIAAEKPDFDYDRFFRAYADRYAIKEKLLMAMAQIEDVHPMNYLRINANLQQYDEFLDFYDIREGDNMYLAPEDRVAIW